MTIVSEPVTGDGRVFFVLNPIEILNIFQFNFLLGIIECWYPYLIQNSSSPISFEKYFILWIVICRDPVCTQYDV